MTTLREGDPLGVEVGDEKFESNTFEGEVVFERIVDIMSLERLALVLAFGGGGGRDPSARSVAAGNAVGSVAG
eukprot:CAMPEP_0182506154 /NCGR_PEP_ID=MMETSP1321-20130603/20681_1 /TAXON_ID=91990 /ORGANISM="Bolidomonas sp., Strain RCC1657" /LENGTH=72 /DNA_ID=CAMNT_0024711827 /DNA_START=223 /DNA_END=441 /DNA_ORIENTATION=-